jgi:hypothetical protein
MQPLMRISSSEPEYITNQLRDIAVLDTYQIYPDYLITSQHDFTVGIARASVGDLMSNKLVTHSHIANELSKIETDVKIFLLEDFFGMDKGHNVVTKYQMLNSKVRRNYVGVINTILSACIANNTLWVPSASAQATIQLLRNWNNNYFQNYTHMSLQIRPEKAEKVFTLSLDESQDKLWWLNDIPNINIGHTKATYALNKYKSLMRLFMQDRTSLQDIPLWGKQTADKFRNFLDNEK